MRIILLSNVRNLGTLGDTVKVKPGYARNYLIPRSLAVLANAANVIYFEQRKAELGQKSQQELEAAQARLQQLQNVKLVVKALASEEGKLYGSVGTREIAMAAGEHGIELQKQEIRLSNGPIRLMGVHQIFVQLHSDVVGELTIEVVAQ